jgi:hypothetical protein
MWPLSIQNAGLLNGHFELKGVQVQLGFDFKSMRHPGKRFDKSAREESVTRQHVSHPSLENQGYEPTQ